MALLLKEAPKFARINCFRLLKRPKEFLGGNRRWELVSSRSFQDGHKRDRDVGEWKKNFHSVSRFPRFLYSTSTLLFSSLFLFY